MPRVSRKDLNTKFLHVMVQGVNKEYIFKNEEYIETYLNIIEQKKEDYNFSILAYCIMSNHAHFLIYTEDIEDFGKFMHRVNLKYSSFYNNNENRCGVVFRNRYKAEPIYDIKYLVNCIKYIHENPVKAKIVEKCEEYKYSSHFDYLNNQGITKSEIMKKIFGEQCDFSMLISKAEDKRFMDVDKSKKLLDKYFIESISEFVNDKNIEIALVFYNKKVFKELVIFLKEKCGFTYIEIQNFFEISRAKLELIRKS